MLTTNYKIGVEKQIQNFKFPKGCFAGFFLFSWNMPFYFQLIIVVIVAIVVCGDLDLTLCLEVVLLHGEKLVTQCTSYHLKF